MVAEPAAGAKAGGFRRRGRPRLRWQLAIAGALLAALLGVQLVVAELRVGNRWAIGWGIAAVACFLVASAYGARRRMMRLASRSRFGVARDWLQLHLLAGLLFLPLVGLHTAFGLPGGGLNGWLWGFAVWSGASGLVGLLLQRWLPKALSSLGVEVLYERIPELADELRERAAALAEELGGPVATFHEHRLAPSLARPRRRWRFLVAPGWGTYHLRDELDTLRALVDPADRERVAELAAIYRAKLDLDAHYTLQPLLRGWLALHLPAAIALGGLIVVHLLSVWLY